MKSCGCEISRTAGGATDAKIVTAITTLLRLAYEYDFGSTTELTLRFISVRTGNIGRLATRLLAPNEPLVWKCGACDAPATLVCSFCMGQHHPFVCARHAPEHTCAEDEAFLPVVNSPRMGVCGYTGEV